MTLPARQMTRALASAPAPARDGSSSGSIKSPSLVGPEDWHGGQDQQDEPAKAGKVHLLSAAGVGRECHGARTYGKGLLNG